jgi:putative endonuclease
MRWEYIAVYIMASCKNGTLYIGVTSNLIKRIYEHKHNVVDGFTKKYNVHSLVYFEPYETMEAAIHREKRPKKYTRQMKIKLIEKNNSDWNDLYEAIAA